MIRKIILNWQTLFFRWHHWLKTQYEHLQACWPGGHFRPQRWHLQPEQQQEEGADRGRAEAELETRRALLLPQAGGREVAQPGQTVGGGVLRCDVRGWLLPMSGITTSLVTSPGDRQRVRGSVQTSIISLNSSPSLVTQVGQCLVWFSWLPG